VKLNPNYADAHFVFGTALPSVGQLDEGIREMREALKLDPLSAHFTRWLGRFLLYSGDYDGAIEQCQRTIEMDPHYFQAFLTAGSAYLGKGQAETALEWFRRGQSLETSVRSYDALIVRALAAMRQQEEALAILERLEEESKTHYLRAEVLAMGHAAVGNLDRAFQRLDDAVHARSAGLIYVHLDPAYEPLPSDPRFQELTKQIGVR
jgi:tetratricopeptide (TPR) repeat protein